MPGLVGLITKMPSQEAIPQLMRMVESVCHGPSYNAGTWVDKDSGVYLGWTALRGSFSDGMPVWNERQDVLLAFSGEEFPRPGTELELKSQGHELGSQRASYLVHLYEEQPAFPTSLNGRFHGLVVDRSKNTAMLFNDRYGMHRVYYHESQDAFYFSVEAKAILAVCPELRSVNAQSLGEFIVCGCTLQNKTLFSGIHVLPPGSAWTFRQGKVQNKDSYFDPAEWEEQERLTPEAYYQELRGVFAQNLPRFFAGPEPIGMSLTGGLDTRIILASRTAAPGTLPCYTFGSMFHENRDVQVARRVAKACGQSHQEIVAGSEFLKKFAHYAERAVYLSDGCTGVGFAPDAYVGEIEREVAPIRMTGNYGGEVLRGVRAFKPNRPHAGLFQSDLLPQFARAGSTYNEILRGHPVSFAVFKQGPWFHHGVLSLDQMQLTLRSPYLDNDFVRTVFRGPESLLQSNEVSTRLIADGNPMLLRIPTDRGLLGRNTFFPQPLSRSVLEFSFKAEYAYDMGMPQWLARADGALSFLHLERMFLGRHKAFHFRIWYRDYLAGYVREILLDPRTLSRPYLDRRRLEAIVQGHLSGYRNYTSEIHMMLTLELLHRRFIDNGSQGQAEIVRRSVEAPFNAARQFAAPDSKS